MVRELDTAGTLLGNRVSAGLTSRLTDRLPVSLTYRVCSTPSCSSLVCPNPGSLPWVAVSNRVERSLFEGLRALFLAFVLMRERDCSQLNIVGVDAPSPSHSGLSRRRRPLSCRASQQFRFDFQSAEKPYESYSGLNVRLRYFVRVTIALRGKNVTQEADLVVQNIQQVTAHKL